MTTDILAYFFLGLLTALVGLLAAQYYLSYKTRQQLVELNATLKKLSLDTIKVGNEQLKGLVEITRNTYRMR